MTPDQLAARVRGNNDWLAYSKNLYRDECRRIGAEARAARIRAGKSLREVARAMKISAPHLSDLERGNRYWTTDTLLAWKSALES